MRSGASLTAQWVAIARGLGARLPAASRLVDDPFGTRFAEGPMKLAVAAGLNPAMRSFALYMQVRTRVIDDVLRAFLAEGGTQVVLLGAGFDCRAARLAPELAHAVVFEIDHPLTQARKRAVIGDHPQAPVRYLAWDFEHRSVDGIPAALHDLGHDARERTLTIWEGVTMYLSASAIAATVAAVRGYSCAGSPFVLTLRDRTQLEHPTWIQALGAAAVRVMGEPFTFGWTDEELPPWLAARGFQLAWHRDSCAHADLLLPAVDAQRIALVGKHSSIALAHAR